MFSAFFVGSLGIWTNCYCS